jgi:hypothetical protein
VAALRCFWMSFQIQSRLERHRTLFLLRFCLLEFFSSDLQIYGKVYLQWNDRSLCETGFTFDRSGEQFTSLYSVQDATVCHLQHAPTSVYDDLAVAQRYGQALVGTTQKYCVRATADIGCDSNKYESDGTCNSLTIAWESSLSGTVRGRRNTGNAPTKGAIISWYFVNYPNIQGSGRTNEDGYFVEESGEKDINIQARMIYAQLP